MLYSYPMLTWFKDDDEDIISDFQDKFLISSSMTCLIRVLFVCYFLFNGVILSSCIISYVMRKTITRLTRDEDENEDENEDDENENEEDDNEDDENEDDENEDDEENEDDDDDDDENEDSEYKYYEYMYVSEFENMIEQGNTETVSETEKLNLSNLVIMESTPNGNIVMSYEYDKEVPERSMFTYYINDKSIPYKYLDTVARKYAYVYKCPEIYSYIKDEINKELKRIKEEKTQNENKAVSESKKDSVFASFKNYKSQPIHEKKYHILVTKNKYKYLGTVDDYNNLLLSKDERTETKPLSFGQYKQLYT